MKSLILLLLLISLNSYAITYEVIGPCSSEPTHQGSFDISDLSMSVGKYSLNIFEREHIPYLGNENGFNSIVNTPVGLESIEVISDTKMRAYGWCYSVNGLEPDVLAGEYFFTAQTDKLIWFYAYSTYENGVWLDYCVPSHRVKAEQFCSKKE